jgi:hypothetical protein
MSLGFVYEIIRNIPEKDMPIITSCDKSVFPVIEVIIQFLLCRQLVQED